MKTLSNATDRQRVLARIDALTPTSERLWGTMTVEKMLCHCGDQLRLALGEVDIPRVASKLAFPPLRWMVINVMPWPKGKIKTAPALLATDSKALDQDRQDLRQLIERCAERDVDGQWGDHPLFGQLSGKQWGRLAWRHLNHHLTQFSS
jgi:hypothetical protein